MSDRSRLFRRTPQRTLALAALSVAFALGCRAVPEVVRDTRPPASDVGKDQAAAAVSPAPADPLLRAERLRRLGPGRADALARGLRDEDSLVRGVALMCWTNETPEAVKRHLLDGAAPAGPVRFVLLDHLKRARAAGRDLPFRVPTCEWARTDDEPAIRSLAAAACAGEPGVDPRTLESLARDPNWMVRARLAAALAARSLEPDAAVVLNQLAHDPHATVRRAASPGPAPS